MNLDQLRSYYQNSYPFDEISRWLCPDYNWLQFREVAFFSSRRDGKGTYARRFLGFKTSQEWKEAVLNSQDIPERFEIGALYNLPLVHKSLTGAFPIGREFVIDIDTDDYDMVRRCCSKENFCFECWKLLTTAAHVINILLKECFDLHHVLWVYSGRRGLHGWVCDNGHRKMSNDFRTRIAQFLSMATSRDAGRMFDYVPQRVISKLLAFSFDDHGADFGPLARLFYEREREIFAYYDEKSPINNLKPIYKVFLERIQSASDQTRSIAQSIDIHIKNLGEDVKYSAIKTIFKNFLEPYPELMAEFVWFCVGPRLDVNVSAQINHLLKAPFCVHPKTGYICVPIDNEYLVEFFPDENSVPKLSTVVENPAELNIFVEYFEQFFRNAHRFKKE
ncbi:hypothetical protein RCL1_000907 [Eukaryota sp. TZLM3-RCL]